MDRESHPRVVYWVIALLVSSAVGYVVSGTTTSAGAPIHFSFSSSTTTQISVDIPDFEALGDIPSAMCQWPDGKASISVAEARTFDCFPEGVGQFPVPKRHSVALLFSPIGGAKYPAQNGDLSDDIRVITSPNAEGVMDVGPVLMQFGLYSGGAQPSVISDPTSLWIFDYRTEDGSEVIRISKTTGALLQRTAMPGISRPVIGVNRYGFWMAQAGNSMYDQGVQLGVWFVAIGATHGGLLKATTGNVWRIEPAGDSMDVSVSPGWMAGNHETDLWRFTPTT